MGRHLPSVSAWILVVRPPRERPMACVSSPFTARGRAMPLDRRAVNQHLGRRASRISQGMKQVAPNAFVSPSNEAVIEGLARAIHIRRVDPAPSGFQKMDDAADHAAIIDTRLAACIRRQIRLDPPELLFRQPEIVPIYHSSPFGGNESHYSRQRNLIYGAGP